MNKVYGSMALNNDKTWRFEVTHDGKMTRDEALEYIVKRFGEDKLELIDKLEGDLEEESQNIMKEDE